MLKVVFVVVLAACGSRPLHTVTLVNQTDRAIEEVFIYPTGDANHGRSRGSIAPNASLDIPVRAGNVDVLAVSARVRLDARTRERRTASQTLQLNKAVRLVFHDADKPVSGVDRPDTFGVSFRVAPPPPPPSEE